MKKLPNEEKKILIKELKTYIKPTTKLFITIPKVSSSGMSRRMCVYVIKNDKTYYLTYQIAELLELSFKVNDVGMLVRGCGMNMCFWLANAITKELWSNKKPKTLKGNGGGCLDWQCL